MKPWQRAVAVPLLILLTGAGIAATLLYRPAPAEQRAPSRRPLKPQLTPPLRHGGCQGKFWLTEKDLRHPQNYKSYFTRCCYIQQQRQATAIPGSVDLGEAGPQLPGLLSGYERQRRNRPMRHKLKMAPLLSSPFYEHTLVRAGMLTSTWPAQQRIRRRLNQAGLPAVFRSCSFQTLEPVHSPGAFKICRAYAQAGQHQGKPGLLLAGPPGTGKTSLAVAILRHTVERTQGRCGVRFWNVPRSLEALNRPSKGLQRSVLDLLSYQLVVLDDVGKPPFSGRATEQFYALIEVLWSECRQVVVTISVPPAVLVKRLDLAVLSRILRMCHEVHL